MKKTKFNYYTNINEENKKEINNVKYEIKNNISTIIKDLVSVKIDREWTGRGGYYTSIQSYSIRSEEEFHNELNKLLDKEVEYKYKDLVNRITKVVGEIEDVDNLSIGGQSGEINGIIKGSKGKATIETISAGGYNVQCFHYRVLIKPIKEKVEEEELE